MLAIRGDDNGYDKPMRDGRSNNPFARDLVETQRDEQRRYLDRNQSSDPTSFCIGVSGYPKTPS